MADLLQGYLIVALKILYCKIFFDTFCKQNDVACYNQCVYFAILSASNALYKMLDFCKNECYNIRLDRR